MTVTQLTTEQVRVLRKLNIPHHVSKFNSTETTKTVYIMGKIGYVKELQHQISEPVVINTYPIKESILKTKELLNKVEDTISYLLDLSIVFSEDTEFIYDLKKLLQNYEDQRLILKAVMIRICNRKQITTISTNHKNKCILCGRDATNDYCNKCHSLMENIDPQVKTLLVWINKGLFELLVRIKKGIPFNELRKCAEGYEQFERLIKYKLIEVNYYSFPHKIKVTKNGHELLKIVETMLC